MYMYIYICIYILLIGKYCGRIHILQLTTVESSMGFLRDGGRHLHLKIILKNN